MKQQQNCSDSAITLGRLHPFEGKRLAIMTNGGGIGVLAVDRVIDLGGTLATLSAETVAKLDSALVGVNNAQNRTS